MKKIMNTKEAIERVQTRFNKWALDEEDLTALQALGLVTIESEDERIRKALIHLINEQDGFLTAINGISVKDIIAYLEKQKLISDSLKAAGIYVRQDGSIERRTIPYLENQKEPRNYRKLYEDIVKSEWFKNAYEGKSLGGDDEQKLTEWSDEDEKALKRAINICESDFGENCETARFLKSLPERFNLLRKR